MDKTRKSVADRTIDFLVDHRWLLGGTMLVTTVVFAFFAGRVTGDPSMKSGIDATSEAYQQLQDFMEHFGNEEFMLVALKQDREARDPEVLKTILVITEKLKGLDNVTEVVSLSNLKCFSERKGLFGIYPVVSTQDGIPVLPEKEEFDNIRKALPITDFLVSQDLKTVGFLVRTDEKNRFEIPLIEKLVSEVSSTIEHNMLAGSQYRIVGPQVIRLAVHHYNLQTAVIFGILCLVIGTGISLYIFKTMRVAVITYVIVGLVVVWIVAFMSLSHIPLSSTTALSFGLVLVVSVATTIRIVTHFNERYQLAQDRIEAMRQALRVVFVPCLICSITTAVGFGTTMVSSIPMVFQLGLVMSLGVMLSFVMAVLATVMLLPSMRPLKPATYTSMTTDWVAKILVRMENIIFHYGRSVTVIGLTFTAIMLAGIPYIRSDTQLLRMLAESTQQIQDLQFVEEQLTSVHSLELVIEKPSGAFKNSEAWKKVAELDEKLRRIPEVVSTDSFLPLLAYLQSLFQNSGVADGDLFSNPGLIRQLLVLTSLSPEGKRFTARYLDDSLGRLHVSVRIKNSPSVPITETIQAVRSTAESVLDHGCRITVTGDIAVFVAQSSDLVRSQIRSLGLAFILITGLLMINLGSVAMGLISLIPNIPPVALIFGLMGWTGIALDVVTVFAASVALGLAVDDTIHFLSQLKLDVRRLGDNPSVEHAVRSAYDVTAKAMLSTSLVLFFGFLVLIISPFRPVVSFGVLGSASILTALLADVVFMPSVIVSSNKIRNLITRRMGAHTDDQIE